MIPNLLNDRSWEAQRAPHLLVLSMRSWSLGQQLFVGDTGEANFFAKNHYTFEETSIVVQDSFEKEAGSLFAKPLTYIRKSL